MEQGRSARTWSDELVAGHLLMQRMSLEIKCFRLHHSRSLQEHVTFLSFPFEMHEPGNRKGNYRWRMKGVRTSDMSLSNCYIKNLRTSRHLWRVRMKEQSRAVYLTWHLTFQPAAHKKQFQGCESERWSDTKKFNLYQQRKKRKVGGNQEFTFSWMAKCLDASMQLWLPQNSKQSVQRRDVMRTSSDSTIHAAPRTCNTNTEVYLLDWLLCCKHLNQNRIKFDRISP